MIIIALDDEMLALESLCAAIKACREDAEIHSFMSANQALAWAEKNPADIAFLDIQGMDMDGVSLAKKLKQLYPRINIIFCTGYSEYALDAFSLNASGYLLKPVTQSKVAGALSELRYNGNPQTAAETGRGKIKLRFQCFGNFEIFCNGKPLAFKYAKSKELLALLFDKKGVLCSNNEIMSYLWEDDRHASYLKQLRRDVDDVLRNCEAEDVLIKHPGKIALNCSKISSDLQDWQDGKLSGINAYQGEYMSQYSWAEDTNGMLFGKDRF